MSLTKYGTSVDAEFLVFLRLHDLEYKYSVFVKEWNEWN